MRKRIFFGLVVMAVLATTAHPVLAGIQSAQVYRAENVTHRTDVQGMEDQERLQSEQFHNAVASRDVAALKALVGERQVEALLGANVPSKWDRLPGLALERNPRHVLDDPNDPGGF